MPGPNKRQPKVPQYYGSGLNSSINAFTIDAENILKKTLKIIYKNTLIRVFN